MKVEITTTAEEELISTLCVHDEDDLDDDKTGPSCCPDFAGSVGNKSLSSMHSAKYAAVAKDRALELARVKNKLATQAKELADERKQCEEMDRKLAEALRHIQ